MSTKKRGIVSKISGFVEYMRATKALSDGIHAMETNQREDAITIFDTVVRRFGNREEPDIQSRVLHALSYKAILLVRSDDKNGALALYTEVLHRFRLGPYVDQKGVIAQAMYNRAILLDALGERESAIAQNDELCGYSETGDNETKRIALNGLFNKAVSLMDLGRFEDAILAFEAVMNDSTIRLHPHLQAAALYNRGKIATYIGRPREARATFIDLVHRYEDSRDAAVQVCVEMAREQVALLPKRIEPIGPLRLPPSRVPSNMCAHTV